MILPDLLTAVLPGAFIATLVAAIVATAIVVARPWHMRFTADSDFSKPQRIHRGTVPRIGGLAILAGLVAGMGYAVYSRPELNVGGTVGWWLVGLLGVAAVGLVEDITQRVSPRVRILWMFAASLISLVGTGYWLNRLDVPGLDLLMAWPVVGVAFSVFACVGAINAYNIIDGLNGLLAGVSGFSLFAIAAVAAMVGDTLVLQAALCVLAALTGWLPFNWPRARMFAGDAGAYSVGFATVVLLMALVMRNNAVSPWFGLLAAALPVTETLYSMWRRFRSGLAATAPDQAHLHQLVRQRLHWIRALRLLRRGGLSGQQLVLALRGSVRVRGQLPGRAPNGSVSPMLWVLHGSAAALGIWHHDDTPTLVAVAVVFGVCFVALHRRLDARTEQLPKVMVDRGSRRI